jgi:anti-anti-sigma regulatory factor
MLRITRTANGDTVFRISGELDGENAAEVAAVIGAENEGTRILLDLTDLRSVDGEAVRSLEKWEAESIKLKNCAPYIREWIRRLRAERLEQKPEKNASNGSS